MLSARRTILSSPSVKNRVQELAELVSSNPNENIVFEQGEQILDDLREGWKAYPDEFDDEIISNLKDLAEKVRSAELLSDIVEDMEYMNDHDSIADGINELSNLASWFGETKLALRAKKEIRELIERRSQLPAWDVSAPQKVNKTSNHQFRDTGVDPSDAVDTQTFYGESLVDLVTKIKALYSVELVFVQCGYFYEVYNEDARLCSDLLGWNVGERGETLITGCPIYSHNFRTRLQKMGQSHCLVSQLKREPGSTVTKRAVTEIWRS